MKKFVLFLGLMLLFNINVSANDVKKDDVLVKIEQETEKYKKDCYDNEAFPGDFNNYSFYNDDLKEGYFRYHQCLKKVIIQKINEMAKADDAKKMIAALDKLQEATSDFYWTLYTSKITAHLVDQLMIPSWGNILKKFLKISFIIKPFIQGTKDDVLIISTQFHSR